MELRLHANATTTPKTRAYIQRSKAPVAVLAAELGVGEKTIRRWRSRKSVADRSHTPKRLAISLSAAEERLVLELRTALALPLDDIVEVMRRCVNAKLSRSAIHRCLRRHGVSARPKDAKPQVGSFETAGVGFIHVDLKHLTRLNGHPSFVFVAIDRATRFVHIEVITQRDAATVAACLARFLVAFPHKVQTILTDNGSEFTDRFGGAYWSTRREPTGRHAFDRVCARHGIGHRLTRPFRPQTNGMVERFNRRLSEAIGAKQSVAKNEGKNKFHTHAERNAFLHAFVERYNRTRLKCLDYRAPAELLLNPPEPNTSAGMTDVGRRPACPFSTSSPRRRGPGQASSKIDDCASGIHAEAKDHLPVLHPRVGGDDVVGRQHELLVAADPRALAVAPHRLARMQDRVVERLPLLAGGEILPRRLASVGEPDQLHVPTLRRHVGPSPFDAALATRHEQARADVNRSVWQAER